MTFVTEVLFARGAPVGSGLGMMICIVLGEVCTFQPPSFAPKCYAGSYISSGSRLK